MEEGGKKEKQIDRHKHCETGTKKQKVRQRQKQTDRREK